MGTVIIKNNVIKIVILLLVIILILAGKKINQYFTEPAIVKGVYHEHDNYATVEIPKGITTRSILDSLFKKDLISHYRWSLGLIKVLKLDKSFRAGLFDIPDSLNDYQTLIYLSKAPMKLLKITIPEGLDYKKIAAVFDRRGMGDSLKFVSLCEDKQFIGSLGINKIETLEGYLLADTYFFPYGISEEHIIGRLVGETNAIFAADSVIEAMDQLKMSRRDILTLASIIKGEVIFLEEAKRVSSVYHNRLNKRWRLQADPTIQYILPGKPKRLLYKDLNVDSPYNTYKYRGLPPGPINNPGRICIMAALFPEKTDFMYFVAIGDGYHHFSKTIKEHNIWKRKFNRVRKKVYGR